MPARPVHQSKDHLTRLHPPRARRREKACTFLTAAFLAYRGAQPARPLTREPTGAHGSCPEPVEATPDHVLENRDSGATTALCRREFRRRPCPGGSVQASPASPTKTRRHARRSHLHEFFRQRRPQRQHQAVVLGPRSGQVDPSEGGGGEGRERGTTHRVHESRASVKRDSRCRRQALDHAMPERASSTIRTNPPAPSRPSRPRAHSPEIPVPPQNAEADQDSHARERHRCCYRHRYCCVTPPSPPKHTSEGSNIRDIGQ